MPHLRCFAFVITMALGGALLGPNAAFAQSASTINLSFNQVIGGLDSPVAMVDANDGSGRFFIVEKTGKVRVFKDGALLDRPLLDISSNVANGSEQGLLSIALHPNFAKNGQLFIDYTDVAGNSQIERWTISKTDPNTADPSSAVTILSVNQPYPNHNGGLALFGPDGKLYLGFGDGGSEDDPHGYGQNLGVLLGKILRIDVDSKTGGLAYGIPAGNPFVHTPGARAEIWAYGLRNPWRFSFDRKTNDLLIADVGQNTFEEVDLDPAGKGGLNFGWSIMEANSCFGAKSCDKTGLTAPIFSYNHNVGGCSITGGYVYRGTTIKNLDGVYLAADYCSGKLWEVHPDGKGGASVSDPIETGLQPSSFAEDATGELYIIDLQGAIYKIAA